MSVRSLCPEYWASRVTGTPKIYPVLPDPEAAPHGLLRIIDESGEDYLYPEKLFMRIELTRSLETAIRRTAALTVRCNVLSAM